MQSFLSKIPIYVQWDDHEVTNNWWPGEILGEPTYENDTAANDLAEVSLRALLEFNPINQAFVYRSQQFGEHLEVFFPDFRTYRGPNTDNIKPSAVDMMGEDQLNWLKDGLSRSTATWKLISAHGVCVCVRLSDLLDCLLLFLFSSRCALLFRVTQFDKLRSSLYV